jgi:hypothetical protein
MFAVTVDCNNELAEGAETQGNFLFIARLSND